MLLFLTLGLAAYLSIAAIAAVPALREKPAQEAQLSAQSLQRQIGNAPRVPDMGAEKSMDPTKDLGDYLRSENARRAEVQPTGDSAAERTALGNAAAASSAPPAGTSPAPAAPGLPGAVAQSASSSPADDARRNALLAEAARQLGEGQNNRERVIAATQKLIDSAANEAETARAEAVDAYELSATDAKGSWETVEHFRELVAWFHGGVSRFEQQMDVCLAGLRAYDSDLRHWSAEARDSLRSPQAVELRPTPEPLAALTICQPQTQFGQPPGRPELGSHLGAFGFVAGWLLHTESLPLALIVGLFGFGLMGAAASTFVREDSTRAVSRPRAPMVSDLPGVVIRGLSAALIVFLAAEGGLAIFSGGTGDLNPYILFLTCLIGAVFSEVVWQWAREFLGQKLQPKDQEGEGAKVVSPSKTSAAPARPEPGAAADGERASPQAPVSPEAERTETS